MTKPISGSILATSSYIVHQGKADYSIPMYTPFMETSRDHNTDSAVYYEKMVRRTLILRGTFEFQKVTKSQGASYKPTGFPFISGEHAVTSGDPAYYISL